MTDRGKGGDGKREVNGICIEPHHP